MCRQTCWYRLFVVCLALTDCSQAADANSCSDRDASFGSDKESLLQVKAQVHTEDLRDGSAYGGFSTQQVKTQVRTEGVRDGLAYGGFSTQQVGAQVHTEDLHDGSAYGGFSTQQVKTQVRAEGVRDGLAYGGFSTQQVKAQVHTENLRDGSAYGGSSNQVPHFWFSSRFPEPEYYKNDPFIGGPTQIDDLGLLFAIIKELRPATLVEVGAFKGDSSKVFLSACDEDAMLFSFDPSREPELAELEGAVPRSRYVFSQKGGQNISLEDLSGRKVDFAFIDAGHVFEQSQAIWRNLVPLLSKTAVVAVHDTGFWSKEYLDKVKVVGDDTWRPGPPHGEAGAQYYLHENHIGERKFVNWITEEYPEYETMHFHTLRFLRNGITLVQKKFKLDTGSSSDEDPEVEGDASVGGNDVGYVLSQNTVLDKKAQTIQDGCENFQSSIGGFLCEIEKPEHYLVRNWIPKNATVLELGARFGTTSCEIAKQIGNSGRLVSVEPDFNVWHDLHRNLAHNGCNAHVLQGVVSTKPMFLPKVSGTFYNLRSFDSEKSVRIDTLVDGVEQWSEVPAQKVPNLSLDRVQNLLAVEFDTILIDCEGCLPSFLDSIGGKIPDHVNLVLIEGDMPAGSTDCKTGNKCVDYSEYLKAFQDDGFELVEKMNDCEKSKFGASPEAICMPHIEHYALKRKGRVGVKAAEAEDQSSTLLEQQKEAEAAEEGEQITSNAGRGQGEARQEGRRAGKTHNHAHRIFDHVARTWQSSVEVVAAHYDEDTSWMSLFSSPRVKFTVYSKSPKKPENTIALPNVGREGHTYLHHIVTNYDNLAPWTVFTQATRPAWGYFGPGQQSGHLSDNVVFEDYLTPFPRGKDSFFVFDCVSQWPSGLALMRTGFLMHDLRRELQTNDNCPSEDAGWSPWWFAVDHKERLTGKMGLSQWYHKNIALDVDSADESQTLTLAFAQSGRFAVSRGRIHARPRTYYENLLAQMQDDINPVEGYWLEASWYDIFHPEALQSVKPACVYPSEPSRVEDAVPVTNLLAKTREISSAKGLLTAETSNSISEKQRKFEENVIKYEQRPTVVY